MMTNATAAFDPIAAATAIAQTARDNSDRTEDAHGLAAIIALASGMIVALTAITFMLTSPATIPMWCAAHGGCP
ncbi:MAG TPA: hypothetical protein VHS78_11175 [Candidatus Elarobacter sp.]|jgi:hypothetical protein|nr:hypothetical protein [Candidatus Elarobacter sp.]